MQNIKVGRYKNPQSVGYHGWLEPEDQGWIAFIDLKGLPTFFLHRDPETGAVLESPTCEGIHQGAADAAP